MPVLALLYQAVSTALCAYGVTQGLSAPVVAVMALLAALGGFGVLSSLGRKRLAARALRAVSALVAGACASFALILLMPAGWLPGAQGPLVVAAVTFAAIGAAFRVPFASLTALAGIVLAVQPLPVLSLPWDVVLPLAAAIALGAIGAWRSGSRVVMLAVCGLSLWVLWTALSQFGLHPVQAIGTVALCVATALAVLRAASRGADTGAALGLAALIALGLAAQALLLDPSHAEALLQASGRYPALAALLVGAQGVVLGANLLRWMRGRIGWLGVALPQTALAALAFAVIDPTVVERVTALPLDLDPVGALRLLLGAVVAGMALFAAWRHWLEDAPVLTGIFALAVMIQAGLLSSTLLGAPDLVIVAGAAVIAALIATRLSAPMHSHA